MLLGWLPNLVHSRVASIEESAWGALDMGLISVWKSLARSDVARKGRLANRAEDLPKLSCDLR